MRKPSSRDRSRFSTSVARQVLAAGAWASFASSVAHAQVVRAATRDTIVADPGESATISLAISNRTHDSVSIAPQLWLPDRWRLAMRGPRVLLAPGERDSWLAVVSIPDDAPARLYAIVVGTTDRRGVDTVFVRVAEHRAVDVSFVDAPQWARAGERYSTRIVVHNLGNVATIFALRATSAAHARCDLKVSSLTLEPSSRAVIDLTIALPNGDPGVSDDLLSVVAVDTADARIEASATARVAIVGAMARRPGDVFPMHLTLRSSTRTSGLSPLSLEGAGDMPDRLGSLDFRVRAPAMHATSIAEPDEYFARVRTSSASLRLGDAAVNSSPLTSSGANGFGVDAATATSSRILARVFAQTPRRSSRDPREVGGTIGVRADDMFVAGVTGLERASVDGRPMRVGSINVLSSGAHAQLETELATSDSDGVRGLAGRLRARGRFDDDDRTFAYDGGFTRANIGFVGPLHSVNQFDGSVSGTLARFSLGARTSAHGSLMPWLGQQRWASTGAVASYSGRATLEYERLGRSGDERSPLPNGVEDTWRATTMVGSRTMSVLLSASRSLTDWLGGGADVAHMVGATARVALPGGSSVSAFSRLNVGRTLVTTGGSVDGGVDLHLRPFPGVFADGTGTLTVSDPTTVGPRRLGQFDGSVSRFFANGAVISLRTRVWSGFARGAMPNLIYLECRTPLTASLARFRRDGRVEGRIVDGESGLGVAGALVRIGSYSAVTDGRGRVSLVGVEPGEHHVSVRVAGTSAASLVLGATTVIVDEGRTPARFALTIAPGARARVVVRRVARAGGILTSADSLLTVGGVANIVVALTNGRDTITRITADDGVADFGEIAAGAWRVVAQTGGLPERHVFAENNLDVRFAPGSRAVVELRAVPTQRAITFLDPPPR